ncbi:MAG TPA: hypothetical protein VGE02_08090, partial [Gemmatimonadales bacterium]
LPMHSVALTERALEEADLVLLITDHSGVDYQLVADHAKLVLDTRGAMRRLKGRAEVVGLSGTHKPRIPVIRGETPIPVQA